MLNADRTESVSFRLTSAFHLLLLIPPGENILSFLNSRFSLSSSQAIFCCSEHAARWSTEELLMLKSAAVLRDTRAPDGLQETHAHLSLAAARLTLFRGFTRCWGKTFSRRNITEKYSVYCTKTLEMDVVRTKTMHHGKYRNSQSFPHENHRQTNWLVELMSKIL